MRFCLQDIQPDIISNKLYDINFIPIKPIKQQ
jgi:hypothetical protein